MIFDWFIVEGGAKVEFPSTFQKKIWIDLLINDYLNECLDGGIWVDGKLFRLAFSIIWVDDKEGDSDDSPFHSPGISNMNDRLTIQGEIMIEIFSMVPRECSASMKED